MGTSHEAKWGVKSLELVAEQVLKEFDLSYEEIQTGVVGASRDGGIDSIHVFMNGRIITKEEALTPQNKLERGE